MWAVKPVSASVENQVFVRNGGHAAVWEPFGGVEGQVDVWSMTRRSPEG